MILRIHHRLTTAIFSSFLTSYILVRRDVFFTHILYTPEETTQIPYGFVHKYYIGLRASYFTQYIIIYYNICTVHNVYHVL